MLKIPMRLTRLKRAFERLSIARKTKILFIALAAVSILISSSAVIGLSWLFHDTRGYEQETRIALTGSRLTGSFAKSAAHAEHFLVTGDQSELEQARLGIAATRETLATLRTQSGGATSPLAARLDGLDEASTRLSDLIDIYAANTIEMDRAGISVGMDRLSFAAYDYYERARTVDQDIEETLDQRGKNVIARLTWIIAAIVLLGICAIVAAIQAMRYARSNISAPIERITEATRNIVDGNNSVAIPETERLDEIGELACALRVFKDNSAQMQRLQEEAAAMTKAELELVEEQQRLREQMREEYSTQLAELAGKFERTVGGIVSSVASATTQLQMTASAMAATAEQSAEQTDHVSVALDEASCGVTAAAAASDEFAVSIGEISRQAATSAALARNASASASTADSTISALSSSAAEIGKIVALISNIAQRTNLLALNASIEAARGGEAGRGFAVVAGEVKVLAAQTAEATNEVAQQIRAIQLATDDSVLALREISSQIGQLEATSVSIASAVDQQSVAVNDLSRSIDLAARNTDDVASRIGEVRQASSATGSAAVEVHTSSCELGQQAATLKVHVEEFLEYVRSAA